MKSQPTYPEATGKKSDDLSKKSSRRHDHWIFFTTLVISTVFWLLIKLSDQYTVHYNFNVHLINTPKGERLTAITDSLVDVSVTAKGIDILKLNLFQDMDRLDIDIQKFTPRKKEGDRYFIYTSEITERLAELIGVPKSNVHFSQNTISFTMARLSKKKFPVFNRVKLEFEPQFDLYEEPELAPGEVYVYGPSEVLDTLRHIYTESITVKDINSNRTVVVKVANPLPGLLDFEPAELKLALRVERFTTGKMEIPIETPGLQVRLKLFPKTVTIHYKVAQIDYNRVKATQFTVVTDLQGVDIYSATRLPLKLSKKPDFIRTPTLDPPDVEFLILN